MSKQSVPAAYTTVIIIIIIMKRIFAISREPRVKPKSNNNNFRRLQSLMAK